MGAMMDVASNISWFERRAALVAAIAPGSRWPSVDGGPTSAALPAPPGPRGERTAEQASIERQPVCIGSSVGKRGPRLSDVLYYRAVAPRRHAHRGGLLCFLFRKSAPWGNNWLHLEPFSPRSRWTSFTRVPCSWRPVCRRALYGRRATSEGRGASSTKSRPMDRCGSRTRSPDNATHDPVPSLGASRPSLLDRGASHLLQPGVWSHQLGGHGAPARVPISGVRPVLTDDDAIRPPARLDRTVFFASSTARRACARRVVPAVVVWT